jgi:hypothetical protein
MAQRSFNWHQTDVFTWRPNAQFTPTEQRALTRTGTDKGPSGEVDWFIRFANVNLEGASEGEVLTLQEEFTALEKAHCNMPDRYRLESGADGVEMIEVPFTPTPKDLIEVQKIIQSHLSELADKGFTKFPVMPTQMILAYPRRMGKKIELPSYIPDCGVAHYVASTSFTKLVYYMGHLLGKVGKPVLRCPHCRTIFLRGRRNQEHCSRSCQSVAAVQRRRSEVKALKAKSTGNRKKAVKNGGVGHGTKKR